MTATPSAPQSRRVFWFLLVGLPMFFATFVIFILSDQLFPPPTHGNNSFSRSAIGHHGLAEVLRTWGYPVLKSRFQSSQRVGRGDLLVLLEPDLDTQQDSLKGMVDTALSRGAAILLALPKWSGQTHFTHQAWVDRLTATDQDIPRKLLDTVLPGNQSTITRINSHIATGWHNALAPASAHSSAFPTLNKPQLLANSGAAPLQPLLWGDQGVLLAKVSSKSLYILSDPDLLNNAGLCQNANAAILHSLMTRKIQPGAVVIDEVLHGFFQRDTLYGLLFRFPFVLFILPLALFIVMAVWRCLHRFGAPETPPHRLKQGKQGLLDNTARLLVMGGHGKNALVEYLRLNYQLAGHALGVPPDPEQLAALSRVRGTTHLPGHLADKINRKNWRRHDWRSALSMARTIDQWRREVCLEKSSAAAAPPEKKQEKP